MILKNTWEYNVLEVYDYRKNMPEFRDHVAGPTKLDHYYRFIIDNHHEIAGNIIEAGVFKGKSLLSTAMLLKEIGSEKIVYGFDSFQGFPPVYSDYDQLEYFEYLKKDGKITQEHYDEHLLLKQYRALLKGCSAAEISVQNIATSGDFSDGKEEYIREKAAFLGLDNIRLIKGDFRKTMASANFEDQTEGLMAALLDCDLYESYKIALGFIWPKLNQGGYIFLDEYFSLKYPGARIAVDEFFAKHTQKPEMHSQTLRDFQRWFVKK